MLVRYSPLYSELMLRCNGWLEGGATSGSLDFGLGEQSGSIANGTVNINIPIENTRHFTVSGSLDLTGLDLVPGDQYNVFTTLNAHGFSGSANFTNRAISAIMDSTQFAGSGSSGNIYVNSGGSASTHPQSFVYFHDANATGYNDEAQYLRYDPDEAQAKFKLSSNLLVGGPVTASNLISNANAYVNYNGVDGDSFVYFYDSSSPTGESLMWDDSEDTFVFSNNLASKSNIHINFDGADGDSHLYFYDGSSATGKYLMWDDNPGTFKFNDRVHILRTDYADMQLQATDADSNARFILQNDAQQYRCGIDGADKFIIGDDTAGPNRLVIDSSGNVDIGGTTNYTEIKADGEINLHGAARVTKHIRVAAPSWHKGVSGPVDGDIGIFHTLVFDEVSDDEAHYSLIAPLSMATGTDIEIKVDWSYTGTQDNGKVYWAMEYIGLASGSTVAGSTSTTGQLSTGNHMTGRMERTSFATGLEGITPHEAVGLRFYRDVSEGDTLTTSAHMMQVHFMYTSDKLGEAT